MTADASAPDQYRRNVAVIVLNGKGEILACRRSDQYHSWQLPQGGIDEGESLEAAMFRELEEEIGTRDVTIIGSLPHSIKYDWPSKEYYRGWRGQEQFYFLTRLNPGAAADLNRASTKEFDMTAWMGLKEFLEKVSGFKTDAYHQALRELHVLFPDTIIE